MTAWAVVVAAGQGARLGATGPKPLVPLGGRPLLEWSLQAALAAPSVTGIVVACGPAWIAEARSLVGSVAGTKGRVCPGGSTRHGSVRAALEEIEGGVEQVVIHDAARPLAGPELFERALAALERAGGAICAIPMTDTVKRAEGERIVETLDRSALWRAQTPQAFRLAALRGAMGPSETGEPTDEAAVLERAGETVVLVPGDERNIKITGPADLALAEALLRARAG